MRDDETYTLALTPGELIVLKAALLGDDDTLCRGQYDALRALRKIEAARQHYVDRVIGDLIRELEAL